MTRRCSHCGQNGHNSRTCPDRGIRLFGVRLTESSSTGIGPGVSFIQSKSLMNSSSGSGNMMVMRKSASMSSLQNAAAAAAHSSSPGFKDVNSATPEQSESWEGYASDGLVQSSTSNARERKKGVPWTEEEHRFFLLGLRKLGKGDWRGISRSYVTSRTPTQVASHAQKYFIRQSNLSKRKRRSSLFDISPETQAMAFDEAPTPPVELFIASCNSRPPLPSAAAAAAHGTGVGSDKMWLGISNSQLGNFNATVPLKPVVKTSGSPGPGLRMIDEHSELTRLSLGSSSFNGSSSPPSSSSSSSSIPGPPSLGLKLEHPSSRQSAFHANSTGPAASGAPPTSGALNTAISVV